MAEVLKKESRIRLPGRPRPETLEFSTKDNGDRLARANTKKTRNDVDGNNNRDINDAPILEFVTFTGQPTKVDREEISKKIRTQVMRDYIRKQNQQAQTGITKIVRPNPEQPSQYKSKFKLNTWSHKTKTKSILSRLEREALVASQANAVVRRQSYLHDERFKDQQPHSVSFFNDHRIDPFNSLSVNLGHHSENLLVHYHNSYSMNSIAVNPEGDFFSQAKTDPVVLHSILYLVALHYNLKRGVSESSETLHHGSEAFKIINERLEEEHFSDKTIAAVAMLVTKENLNGNYDLSNIHMQGLEYMVKARGGINMVKGVFQRIITWSDFCYANVWNCQPRFLRLDYASEHHQKLYNQESNCLRTEDLFGSDSPIISIFKSLRILSYNLDPSHVSTTDRLAASNMIYDLEYTLLSLNKENSDDLGPTSCIYSFEAVPLKTAAHLYLYLVIREIPPRSQLLYRLVERLQDALEIQLGGWWNSTPYRKTWLLWILFIGGAAAAGRHERWWFVRELALVCHDLDIWSFGSIQDTLKKVLWQDAWCAVHCASLWEEMEILQEDKGITWL